MASNMFKGYSILFYLLTIIVFFFGGLFYAGMIDAGKGQGLAGGAIVLSYGVGAGFLALMISIFLAFKLSQKLVVRLNIVLALIMIALLFVFVSKIKKDGRLGCNSIDLLEKQNTFQIHSDKKVFKV